MSAATEFDVLLQAGQLDTAGKLLQRELASAVVIDPTDTALWYIYADRLAAALRERGGLAAPELFWLEMLDTFLTKIEPRFGRVHKGHIFFRLAWCVCSRSLDDFMEYLRLARAEDLTSSLANKLSSAEAEAATCEGSAHITLALVEGMRQFGISQNEVERFLMELIIPAHNAATAALATSYDTVASAIAAFLPDASAARCNALYQEVVATSKSRLSFAIVAAVGSLAESILLAVLIDIKPIITLPGGALISRAKFKTLVDVATARNLFPSPHVRAGFELVRHFRNRIHPGNELAQTYRLTPQVGDIIRVVLEFAILQWAAAV
jgi:hypothetical protein